MKKKFRLFAADFETTVYEGQTRTDVWASAFSELFTDTEFVVVHHTIADTYNYFSQLNEDIVAYYHNLKFDGAFWLDYLMVQKGFTVASYVDDQGNEKWYGNKKMPVNSLKCSISDMGQWYTIVIKTQTNIIELRDSLKLMPFTLKRIGDSFKLKHRKLEMEYTGFRYPGCEITEEEIAYISNDVLVLREALEFMFSQGHDKLTIGACCLQEFKVGYEKHDYDALFPNLYNISIPSSIFGCETAGEYVRRSYRGGWCYVVKGKTCEVKHNGTTADVNSLYPSMMSSESGNYYPCGRPEFYNLQGRDKSTKDFWLHMILSSADDQGKSGYYFVRFKTRFYLKEGKLPFIQIKNTLRFSGNVSLETSDYYDKRTQQYYTQYYAPSESGEPVLTDTAVTLTMTMIDLKLMLEHYDVVNFELLDFCRFNTDIGLFDSYMEKYKRIKQTTKGAERELAKLFLNNLYGKMAASTNSSYKVPFVRPDNVIGFRDVHENDKKPGYIPIGSAITSYARNFTIRAAQTNYYGVDEPGFIYADTDSIHCDLPADSIKGIRVHPTDFCAWKLESSWDSAIFTRQKTYIEHITAKDLEPVDTPYYDVKCAGMPSTCKQIFIEGLEDGTNELTDFDIGLILPGKLMPKRIPGGVLLVETTYEMR